MSKVFRRLFLRNDSTRAKNARRPRLLRAEALEPRLALSTIVEDTNWAAADGGAKDLNTGLVWSTSAAERTHSWWTYNGAVGQANNLVEGGFSDWRMPTQAELQEAASHGVGNHAYTANGAAQIPAVWSTQKCSAPQGGHNLVSLFDGTTSCFMDASGFDSVAVRGTRTVTNYTTPNIRVFSQLVYAAEGGQSGRFTLALDTQPTANVTIPIASGDTAEGTVSASQLIFTPTNWNVPQGVNITSVDDIFFDPGATYQVILGSASSADASYDSQNPPDVTVVALDNETALLTAGTDKAVSEDGVNTGYINIRLGGKPKSADPVYVDVTSLDTTEGTVPPGALVFNQANWDVPQRVDVLGVADATPDGDQTFEVQRAIGAGSPPEWLAVAPVVHVFKSIDIDGLSSMYSSGNVNLAIPDPGTVTSTIVVPAPTDGSDRIGDLNVSLNINHTYDLDLTATLISPSGQRIELFSRIGGSGDNFTNTTFDDEATTGISGASAPFTGTFRLEGSGTDPAYNPLGALDGQAVAGIWKLEVNDAVRKDKGTLVNWSLQFSRIPEPAVASISQIDEALMLLMAEELATTTQRK